MTKTDKFSAMREDATQRIISAATELFASFGYTATTMQMISQKAHVVPSAIYHYYAGKEELLKAVVDKLIARIVKITLGEPINAVVERIGLRAFLRGCPAVMKDNLTEFRLVAVLLIQDSAPAETRERISEILGNIRSYIPALFPDKTRAHNAYLIFDRLIGIASSYLILGNEQMFQRNIDELVEYAEFLLAGNSILEGQRVSASV